MSLVEYVDNFEEVDFAFAELFSDCQINNKPVKVTYQSPDVDLVTIAKPSVVFYRTNPIPDFRRWQSGEIRDNFKYDMDNNLISMDVRKAPEPWSLMYTVRTVYDNQQDGVAFNRFIMRKIPRGAVLIIKGVQYDLDFVSGDLTGSQYKDFGKTHDGKKIFGETYIFRVNILLDVHDRETVKTVTSDINVNQS